MRRGHRRGLGIVGIALAHGLALSVAVGAFGGVSGAHFNPAVTIGFFSAGRIKLPAALGYIVTQLLAATVAAFACKMIFPADAAMAANLGIPRPAAWVSTSTLLLCEFILTFLLMTAIYGRAVDTRGQAVKIGGFGIGLTVTFNILAAGAVTGASMNPARSFGPALSRATFISTSFTGSPRSSAQPSRRRFTSTSFSTRISLTPRRG